MADSGMIGGPKSPVPAILIASAVSVVCLQILPVLSLFFAVSLLVLLLSRGKASFYVAIPLTLIVCVILSLALTALSGEKPSWSDFIVSCLGSAFFLLPLLLYTAPAAIRLRYRSILAGLACAGGWVLLISQANLATVFAGYLKDYSAEAARLLSQGLASTASSTAATSVSADWLYNLLLDSVLFSILGVCVSLYGGSFLWAESLVRKWANRGKITYRQPFFADLALFFPLIAGMMGVIANHFAPNRILEVVSWNVLIASGLFFAFQGFELLSFASRFLNARFGVPRFVLYVVAVFLLFTISFLPFFALLLVAGVIELFVPIRARFLNKNGVDPTPGRDTDHD